MKRHNYIRRERKGVTKEKKKKGLFDVTHSTAEIRENSKRRRRHGKEERHAKQ